MLSGPGIAASEENKKDVPRVENKKNNGAAVKNPNQFAHGGRVGDSHMRVFGAKLAPDGEYYVNDTNRPGKYLRVVHRGRSADAA
jgi:hypothetical protein